MSFPSRSSRFAGQVAWNGVAFAVSLVSGFVLSPLVIRGLGIEAYGVWALVFSLLEYLNIADLGIRSATVKYVAHYSALDDEPQVHRVLNSSIVYFLAMSGALGLLVIFGASWTLVFFKVPPELHAEYLNLLRLTGFTMAAQLLFNVPKAALEAVQEFKLISRINIMVNLIRTTACIFALYFQWGLSGLGWATVSALWLGFAVIGYYFLRRFPGFRPSFWNFDRESFRRLHHYGLPTMAGALANQFLHYGPPMLLGIVKDTASVGYYSLVLRLLAGLYEIVSQLGGMTGSLIAQLAAKDDNAAIQRSVMFLNRYSLALFGFVFVFLMVLGEPLFRLWVGPAIAAECMPLLPWIALGYTFGAAANQHSISALFGLAAHRLFNFSLIVEAAALAIGMTVFVPGRPLSFAAAWWAISLFLNRGLHPTWRVCRSLSTSFAGMLEQIYLRPLIVIGLVYGMAWTGARFFSIENWFSLGLAAVSFGVLYSALCVWLVLDREHRRLLWKMPMQFLKLQ